MRPPGSFFWEVVSRENGVRNRTAAPLFFRWVVPLYSMRRFLAHPSFRSPGCCLTSEASGFWQRGQTESTTGDHATSQRAWEKVFGPYRRSPILALCKVTRPPSGLPLQSPVDPLAQINYHAQRAENQTCGDQWHLKEALHLP